MRPAQFYLGRNMRRTGIMPIYSLFSICYATPQRVLTQSKPNKRELSQSRSTFFVMQNQVLTKKYKGLGAR